MFAAVTMVPAVTVLRGAASVGVVVALLLVFAALLVAYFTVRSNAGDPRMRADREPLLPPDGPQRYRVTIHSLGGDAAHYSVVTGAGTKKAASIAFDSHARIDDEPSPAPEPNGPAEEVRDVRDVRVERLGAVAREADVSVRFEDGDLFDRSEF